MLLHSSGTTSVPKGIMHSSNTLRYASEQIRERWELSANDTNLVVCEFGFVGSLLFGYLVTLLSGATGVLLPRWNAEEALRLTEQHRCTYVLYMPTHGADILRAGQESAARLVEPAGAVSRPGSPRSGASPSTRHTAYHRSPTTASPRCRVTRPIPRTSRGTR